jgi:hypothetical protein
MVLVPTTNYEAGGVASAASVEDHRDAANTTPRPPSPFNEQQDLTPTQAARRLGLTKPNGRPKDVFYKRVLPEIGYQIGGEGGLWRVPPENLDDYRGVAA